MLGSFWDAIGGKLADRWASLVGPALVFWAGGVLAWAYSRAAWSNPGALPSWIVGQDAGAQIVMVVGAVVVVVASAVVVQRLTTPALRLMEGYWPPWFGSLVRRRRERAARRARDDDEAWQQLQHRLQGGELTAEQLAELARLEQRRRHRPSRPNLLLPTRIGNILRAAETRSQDRYGLEAVSVWPHLWLVLPASAQRELAAARASLDAAVAVAIWGVAFVCFTPLAWWALPFGLVVAVAAVAWWVPSRAEIFADLVGAVFDLYRGALYRGLRWPLPTAPAQERSTGEALTRYIVRGSDAQSPEFTPYEDD